MCTGDKQHRMCMREPSAAKVLLNGEVSFGYQQDPPTQHKHHGEEQESKVGVRDVEEVAAPEHSLHQPKSDTVPARGVRVVEVHSHSYTIPVWLRETRLPLAYGLVLYNYESLHARLKVLKTFIHSSGNRRRTWVHESR